MTDILILCAAGVGMIFLLIVSIDALRNTKQESAGRDHTPADTPDSYTRNLIGDSTYNEMVKTVDKIWKRHKTDLCISVSITAGPNSKAAEHELHHLLPGQMLNLQHLLYSGMDCVDVYSNGYRVGRLMLADADKVIEIMKTSSITGVYVAEQNCYGDCSHLSLRIIVFHSPSRRVAPRIAKPTENPYKITYNGVKPLTIFQN